MTTWYPTFRYHPTLAPKGKKFTSEAEFNALSDEWVDTPTKFPVQTTTNGSATDSWTYTISGQADAAMVTDVKPKRTKTKKEQA